LLITHGHFDHIGDAVELAKSAQIEVVCIHETSLWLQGKGVQNVRGMNKGGNIPVCGVGESCGDSGIRVRMVDARHSCGIQDGDQIVYGGEACGFVLTLEDGTKVYHAGDTALFGDMALIRKRYAPDIALLPIGDLYTMDPADAATAVEMLGVREVIPMHHSTFEALPGKPEDFVRHVGNRAQVLVLLPGQTHVVRRPDKSAGTRLRNAVPAQRGPS
ncbi:MAG: metal-dependent hydrolase, partial [Cyanobacteria bacterium REEB65]|nr:metal-dependent hydrolase [Cyanobacteria bacterium REEB65]